jgi:PAS domain S-box-containing protein
MIPKNGTKVIVAFLIALLLLAGLGALSYRNTLHMIADADQLRHNHQVLAEIDTLVRTIGYDAATRRGYLITGNEDFLSHRIEAYEKTSEVFSRLSELFEDNPSQQNRLQRLGGLLDAREEFSQLQLELKRNATFRDVQQSVMSGKGEQLLQGIFDLSSEIKNEQRAGLARQQAFSKSSARESQYAIIAGGLLAFILVGTALWLLIREMANIKKAEEMFRGLLNSAPDAMIIVNREGNIVRVNSETENLFGYSRLELTGLPFATLLPQPVPMPDGDSFADYFAAPEGRKMAAGMELTGYRKDGRPIPVEISLSPLHSKEVLLITSVIRDITSRKRSEKALRESEELMRFVMEADQMGHWEWNPDTGEMTRSARHDLIFGYDPPLPKWSYELFLEHVIPEDREEVNRTVNEGVSSRIGFDFTCRIQRRDDAFRWIRICGRFFLGNGSGKPDRIAGVIRDITDEKNAQDFTHRHEQFRSAVLDAIPAEIAVLDPHGTIIAVNEPWLRFGRENDAKDEKVTAIGANYLEVARKSSAAGVEQAETVAQGISDILAGTLEELRMEYPCDTPRGMKWFLFHAVAAPSQVGGAIIAHIDISQQKQTEEKLHASEELFRTVVGAIPDTVQVKDAEGHWLAANEATVQQFYLTGIDWLGKTDCQIAESSPPEIAEIFQRCHQSDENVWQKKSPIREVECLTSPNGDARVFDVIKVPLLNQDGSRKLLVVIGRDITQQKKAEESLRDFNALLETRVSERTANLETAMSQIRKETSERMRLEEEILQISEREQMRIGQDLHDDLGQQLVGVAMLADMLAKELNQEAHPKGASASKLSHFLKETIITTRNLARSFYPVELQRGGLVIALQDLANRTGQLSRIQCSVMVDPTFQAPKSSEIHLYRIVQESLSNAVKHGHATEIHIECRVDDTSRRITISDNGIGFTPPPDGARPGMGLHLFQYRARLIGARVEVKNRDTGGCVVTCTLPLLPTV